MLANTMASLQVLPAPLIMFIVVLAASAATELATNVAIVAILLPILLQMVSKSVNITCLLNIIMYLKSYVTEKS